MNIDLTFDDLHNFENLDATSRKILQNLKEIGRDRAKGHGGVKLDDLKVVAGALGINKCQKKEILVDLIFIRMANQHQLSEIHKSRFKKNDNTCFRLLNCLMENPDAIARSELLAGRYVFIFKNILLMLIYYHQI